MSERYAETGFAEEMCIGCTGHHWAVAARAFLCIATLGLSEMLRGKQGWCKSCFSEVDPESAPLPRYPRQRPAPMDVDGYQSPGMRGMNNPNPTWQRAFSYPVGAYDQPQEQPDLLGLGAQPPQSPAPAEGSIVPSAPSAPTPVHTSPVPAVVSQLMSPRLP